MQETEEAQKVTHMATVTRYGINDLASTPFVEVLTGDSEAALYRLCRIWAHCNIAEGARFKVEYLAATTVPCDRENDPRRSIPVSTRHAMNPRQQAAYDEASRLLNIQDGDHAMDANWRPKGQG